MAGKSAHEAARAKAAREKKILVVLALPLVLAGFYAYHTMHKLSGSSAPVAAPASSSTGTSTTPASTTTTPTSTTPTGTTESAPTTPTLAPTGSSQLASLASLPAKDPFHDGGPTANSAAGGGGTTSSSSSSTKSAKKSKHQTKTPAGPLTGAVISVNGKLTTVAIGAAFPATNAAATNGIFRLVSLTRTSAKVSVVGGSYASGSNTLTLAVNVAVTLVNTADGKRYTLVLYPQGTVVPGAPSATTTPTTTTTGG